MLKKNPFPVHSEHWAKPEKGTEIGNGYIESRKIIAKSHGNQKSADLLPTMTCSIIDRCVAPCGTGQGDIFFVHNDMGDGWLWATAHRTGEQGLVFQDLVETLDDTIDPNKVGPLDRKMWFSSDVSFCIDTSLGPSRVQVFHWFHDAISKEDAVDLLVKGTSSTESFLTIEFDRVLPVFFSSFVRFHRFFLVLM